MPKRLKYFISSVLASGIFFLVISLPFEARYYGLVVGSVVLMLIYWFTLGLVWENSIYLKLLPVSLPLTFFIGYGMFSAILPFGLFLAIGLSIFFGFVNYATFLVKNIFLVAIGYKTVPLYRAAYTVSLILVLLDSFFLFNSIFSFRSHFWFNSVLVFLASVLLFLYQYWAVTIELPDDGKKKNMVSYVFVPSLILGELALAFSFWNVGVFRGSVYLVSAIYIIAGLLQADIRESRLVAANRGESYNK